MFNWCQNVNIYNVEHHYHFYADSQIQTLKPDLLAHGKLKTGPVFVHSKGIDNKSRIKKGLSLTKVSQEVGEVNKNIKNVIHYKNSRYSTFSDQRCTAIQSMQSNDSIGKIKTVQNWNKSQRRNKSSLININMENTSNVNTIISQKIQSKNKPSFFENQKQRNSVLLTRMYSNDCRASESTKMLVPSARKSLNSDIHEMNTSRNINSETASEDDLSFEGNIKVQQSRIIESSQIIEQDRQNNQLYLRILEASRGEARQASIILSNILGRSGEQQRFFQQGYHPYRSAASKKKRLTLWQENDKQTTFSRQNDNNSECSVKMEQSQIQLTDPRNNFIIINRNKAIITQTCTINLAVESSVSCLVSLKQVYFRQMGLISQQLQMYEFIDQKMNSRDIYRNILKLYQVQMAGGSYILIKQPYTHTFVEYLHENPQIQFQLYTFIEQILQEFAQNQVYPTRLISLQDVVICQSILKIHDLSIFRFSGSPVLEINNIFGNLQFQIQNQISI